MTDRDAPTPRWLRRALAVSLAAHLVVLLMARWLVATADHDGPTETFAIEIAPPAPRAETLPPALPPAPPPVATPPLPPEPAPAPAPTVATAVADAGVPDAAPDARPRTRDAAPDADVDVVAQQGDAGTRDDASSETGATMSNDPNDAGVLGDAAALAGTEALAGDDGEITETARVAAANLLAYMPAGHVVTAMIRFDRLRGTEWAAATERVLAPLPDYHMLVGSRGQRLTDRFETLVISSYKPRRIEATTLVARTTMSTPELRTFLGASAVDWSTGRGGAVGRRRPSPRTAPNDTRVFLSPLAGWMVLARPEDLGELLAPAAGPVDGAVAAGDAPMPEWLRRAQTIEAESGSRKGSALVVSIAALAKRYKVPDLGLGVTEVIAPKQISLAAEVVRGGIEVRGNAIFETEAQAAEVFATTNEVKDKVLNSRLFESVLRRARLWNAVKGLSLKLVGKRISYATSLSIADARMFLASAAATIADRFDARPEPEESQSPQSPQAPPAPQAPRPPPP